jgi:hypothetical protein
MKRVIATLFLGISACATTPSPTGNDLSLHLDSYDPSNGSFALTLRNNSFRSALFLHYFIAFSATPDNERIDYPEFAPAEGEVVMIHGVRLDSKSTTRITGTCSQKEACREAGTHAGIYACWFNPHWECDKYSPIWSDRPLE